MAVGRRSATLRGIAAGTETVEIRLAPSFRISSRVMDAAGNPVPGAVLKAKAVRGRASGTSGSSGPDGVFEIGGLAAGSYSLHASRPLSPALEGNATADAGAKDVEIRVAPK